jgi:oxygen-dependent protoporphyrinogen oxidase
VAVVTVAVIGAGITGLTAAHRLAESTRVLVLEADSRAGGQIRTERHGEFLFEGGPDALVAQKPAGIALCERLGLGGELSDLSGSAAPTQIFRAGRLHPVPEGFLMMAPTRLGPVFRSSLFSLAGKLRMAAEPLVPRRAEDQDDESLASFVTRRFGREVLDRVAEPVIAGLFTADADRLSLRMTMPRFLDLEAKEGSVTRGMRKAAASTGRARPFGHGTGRGGFVALRSGLSRIVEALVERLPPGSLRLDARVASVARSQGGGFSVALASGEAIAAQAVVVACGAGDAADALEALDADLAAVLRRLRYASCATVNVAYPAEAVGARLAGFGFFVPRTENLPILACSYVSEKFAGRAPEGSVVFRAFIGGATRPGALDRADGEIVRDVHETLRRILSIAGEPVLAKVYRAPRSMPQFDVGAKALIDALDERATRHPGLFLAGSIAGAYGLPDCIKSGETAAERASAACVAYQANQKE